MLAGGIRLKTIIAYLVAIISVTPLLNVIAATLTQAQTAPSLDANGWTVFTPSTDTRIIYVSSSTGSDSNSGLSASAAVQSVVKGLSLLRQGYPDWLLFKKGDSWTSRGPASPDLGLFGTLTGNVQGRSASEPMVIGSYDPANPGAGPDPSTGGARPLFNIPAGDGKAVYTFGGSGYAGAGNYLVFVGLEFYNYDRDPNNANYSSAAAAAATVGFEFIYPVSYLLIEDCKISFFGENIYVEGQFGQPNGSTNVSIRRNVITDAYNLNSTGMSQGMYMSVVNNLLVEENLFDHNGWNATVAGAGATVFTHNIYLQGISTPGNPSSMSGPATVRGNIFSNDGTGSQIRAGGTVTNNLWVHNAYNHNIGMPSAFASTISNNVYLEGVDDPSPPNTPYGWGPATFSSYSGDSYNVGTVTISNNIIAHTITHSGNGYGIMLDGGSQGDTITGNIIYDWQNPIINGGSGNVITNNNLDATGTNNSSLAPLEPFPDPGRSIGSYDATLGGAGTLADFLLAARLQSKGNWNAALMANAVNSYIRAGFGIGSDTTSTSTSTIAFVSAPASTTVSPAPSAPDAVSPAPSAPASGTTAVSPAPSAPASGTTAVSPAPSAPAPVIAVSLAPASGTAVSPAPSAPSAPTSTTSTTSVSLAPASATAVSPAPRRGNRVRHASASTSASAAVATYSGTTASTSDSAAVPTSSGTTASPAGAVPTSSGTTASPALQSSLFASTPLTDNIGVSQAAAAGTQLAENTDKVLEIVVAEDKSPPGAKASDYAMLFTAAVSNYIRDRLAATTPPSLNFNLPKKIIAASPAEELQDILSATPLKDNTSELWAIIRPAEASP